MNEVSISLISTMCSLNNRFYPNHSIHENTIIFDQHSNVTNEIYNISNISNLTKHAILKTLIGADNVYHILFKSKSQEKCSLLNLNMNDQNEDDVAVVINLIQNFIRLCLKHGHSGELHTLFFR